MSWWYWNYTITTDSTNPVAPKVVGDTSKLENDVAFLRAALKLAHDRIDELEEDG
jgi:hypothetical protein